MDGRYYPKWKNGHEYTYPIRSICKGRFEESVALCGQDGFIGEFDLDTGKQIRMLPMIFKSDIAYTIVKIEGSDFAIGTDDGMLVMDLKRGKVKLHVLKKKNIRAMAYVGNGQVLIGPMELDGIWKNCEYHIVDCRNGVIRKIADADYRIDSIQLLS